MAYKKTFNPDALPAHAEPEQAAQALAQLSLGHKPANTQKPHPPPPGNQSRPPNSVSPRPQQYSPQNAQSHPKQYNQNSYPPQHYSSRASSPPTHSGYVHNARPPIQRPAQSQQQWAPPQHYPPRTPAPPDPDTEDLWSLFRTANTSRTGSLTSSELGNALVNADADYTPFDPRTITSLMRMFSHSPQGQPGGPAITYDEFQNLWRFLAEWRRLFERFDEDQSGRISLGEFSKAMEAFGYRLSASFVSVLYNAYTSHVSERRGSRTNSHGGGMTFDLFVQACISLKHMTDVFKGYDDDRDGYVTLSFEEFLTEMLRMLQ